MDIKYADRVEFDEAENYPTGTVVSFGDCCWEKLGVWWMYSDRNEYASASEVPAAVLSEQMVETVNQKAEAKNGEKFSIIIPDTFNSICELIWSEEDVDNAFEVLEIVENEKRRNWVVKEAKENMAESLTQACWEYIYALVEASKRKFPQMDCCKECQKRHTGCHSTCREYWELVEVYKESKEKALAAKIADGFIIERMANASSKFSKQSGKSIKLKGWK